MSNKEVVVADPSLSDAVKSFHSGEGQNYLVVGYTNETTIAPIASGPGGLAEASAHFIDSDARFALLRKEHKVEVARTIKFAFVDYTPGTIAPRRKALLSTHKAQIKKLLQPHHVAVEWSSLNELDENEILSKIGLASGTANMVTTKEVYTHKPSGLNATGSGNASSSSFVPQSVTKERELKFENESEFREAIKDVRNDATATDWMIGGYGENDWTTLRYKTRGSGGLNELLATLTDDSVSYAFFRATEQIDKSYTVKFGFIKVVPSNAVPSVKRGLISTHQGFVQKVFEPFHVTFDVTSCRDLSAASIMDKISSYSGTKSHVVGADSKVTPPHIFAGSKAETAVPTPLVPTASAANVRFSDEADFKAALANVRDSRSPVNYLIVTYSGKDTLSLLATGSGDVDELKTHFQSDNANWALVRVTEKIDKSLTTKFALLRWIPNTVPATKKAQLNTKKGAIDSYFLPFHVDLYVEKTDEISQHTIMDKIGSASGSKSHVK